MIKWIVQNNNQALRLIWIDDLFFPCSDFPGTVNEPAMTEVWLNEIQYEQIDDVNNNQGKWLLAIKKMCQQEEIAFGVTNFDYAERNLNSLNLENTLFLIDIQNKFTAKGSLYGYQFYINSGIPLDRLKFFTRFQTTLDEANEKYDLQLSEINYITPSKNTEKLEKWIKSTFIHPNQLVYEGIKFYSQPWNEIGEYSWHHDYLQDPNSTSIKKTADWLDIKPEELTKYKGESAKSLFIWHGNGNPQSENLWGSWSESYVHRKERHLQGKILKKVCQKLGIEITLSDSIAGENWIRMPCNPCLPFLISLKSLLWFMETKEQRAIQEIKINRFTGDDADAYILSLKLQNIGRNDPWGLAKYYYTDQQNTEHTTTKHLKSLTHCQTIFLSNQINDEQPYMRLFREGTPRPVISVEFAPYHINLIWTADKVKLEEEF